MKILSKKHSGQIIKKLNLNRVPEIVLTEYNAEIISNFCDNNASTKYILRDLDNTSGQFYFCLSKEECLNCAKAYTGNFSIAVSCFAYTNIVLLGEVLLTKNNITIIAGNHPKIHHRNANEYALINTITTLDDDKIWEVEGVEELVKYIVEHNLYDVIIEFVVYDKSVGTNKEKVLIVELRTEY